MISGGVIPGGRFFNQSWATPLHRDTCNGLRLDVIDIVNSYERNAFEGAGDATAHFIRRQATIGPDYADDGNADVRKDILGSVDGCQYAQDEQQQCHDDEGIGSSQRDLDNPHLPTPGHWVFSLDGASIRR